MAASEALALTVEVSLPNVYAGKYGSVTYAPQFVTTTVNEIYLYCKCHDKSTPAQATRYTTPQRLKITLNGMNLADLGPSPCVLENVGAYVARVAIKQGYRVKSVSGYTPPVAFSNDPKV